MGCRFVLFLSSEIQRHTSPLFACVRYPQLLRRPDVAHTDNHRCNNDDHERRQIGKHRQESTVDIGAPRLELKLQCLDASKQECSQESVKGLSLIHISEPTRLGMI